MPQNDVFNYRDLAPIHDENHAFRLLRLICGDGIELCCQLFKAYVNGQPREDVLIPYEALSYAWGDPKATKRISLNGKNHWITVNLYEALLNLRQESSDRILWVDALCINQKYHQEKNHQIRHMAAIYRQAERVIFWLGPSTLETNILLGALKQLHLQSSKMACRNWSVDDKRWANLWSDITPDPSVHPQYWKGLRDLLNRTYFTRVWILQECAHANTGIIACGRKDIAAHIFALAPRLLGIAPAPHCQVVLDILPGSPRQGWWKEQRELFVLLQKFKRSDALDPRGKIYALLSMATDTKDFPEPDYNLSFPQVVEQTIHFLFPCQWANGLSTYSYSTFGQFVIDLEMLNNKAFLLAAKQGNTALLPVIANRPGFNVHSLDRNGCNALSLAAEQGETGAIEYLLTVPNIEKNLHSRATSTPLFQAVRNHHTAATIALLNDDEVDEGSTPLGLLMPLELAVETNQELIMHRMVHRIAQRIYSHNKDRAWQSIALAVKFDNLVLIKAFLSGYEFNDLVKTCQDYETHQLGRAVNFLSKNEFNDFLKICQDCVIRQLGQCIFSVLRKYNCLNLTDAGGSRLLTWAIEHGLALLVQQLINDPTVEVAFYDKQGETPLTQAVKGGHVVIIGQLVNNRRWLHNILIMTPNFAGQRPLGIAVRKKNIEAIRLLIQAKDMEINGNCGSTDCFFTALRKALGLGNIDMMKVILSMKGAETQRAFNTHYTLDRIKGVLSNRMRDVLGEYLTSFPDTYLQAFVSKYFYKLTLIGLIHFGFNLLITMIFGVLSLTTSLVTCYIRFKSLGESHIYERRGGF